MAAHASLHSDVSLSLAMALVGSSTAPLLLMDGTFKLIAVSHSFRTAFPELTGGLVGQTVFDLGAGEWDVPQLRSLLGATATGDVQISAYEMDFHGVAGMRNLVLSAQKLDYAQAEDVRLILTVIDVTDARHATKTTDDLLREKTILLQEVQHRVANSLQVISSVILQSAMRTRSTVARDHLTDAHHRVRSIAEVQRQLSVTSLSVVALSPYFAQLCLSLGASMIRDPEQLSILVTTDGSFVDAEVSVSLGLIITELVINALKHAFPGHRRGTITVDYRARGPNWTLSVADDGVGMPTDDASRTPGLGTSIVEALARQLHAEVLVGDQAPGTCVSVVHTQIAAVGS